MVERGLPYRYICSGSNVSWERKDTVIFSRSFLVTYHLVSVLLSYFVLRSTVDFIGPERPRFGYMGCLGSSQRPSCICIIGRQDEGKNACLRNDVKVRLCVVGSTDTVIVIVHNRPTSYTVANHLWLIRNIFHRPDFAKVTR